MSTDHGKSKAFTQRDRETEGQRKPTSSLALGTALRAFAAMLPFLIGADAAFAAGWWNLEWPYRRAVVVPEETKPTHLAGDDVAVVTIYTAGIARPDGRDIRIAGGDEKETPFRILMRGPGDSVTIAFALQSGVKKYYVYFGHKGQACPPAPLEIRRGVLLEMYDYSGSPPRRSRPPRR